MDERAIKRRSWVKNIAIIFLVILLLLTFFSNTILNYTLPEVSAQYPQYDSLTSAVKLTGNIRANENYNVIYETEFDEDLPQSRKVVSVYVSEGSYVEKDSPIMALQGGASEQLKSAQEQYDDLKKTYDLALLDDNIANLENASILKSKQKALDDAKAMLETLEKEYNALLSGEGTSMIIETQLALLNSQLKDLNEQITDIETKQTDAKSKLDAAQMIVDESTSSKGAQRKQLEEAESDLESLKNNINRYQDDIEDYEDQLSQLNESKEYISAVMPLIKEVVVAMDAIGNLDPSGDGYDASLRECESQIEVAEQKLTILGMRNVNDITDSVYSEYEVRAFTVEQSIKDITKLNSSAKEALSTLQAQYKDTEDRVKVLKSQVEAETIVSDSSALLDLYATQLKSLNDDKEKLSDEIAAKQEELGNITTAKTPEGVKKQIEAQKKVVENAEIELQKERISQNKSNTATNQTRADQQKQLAELAKKIESYKTAPEVTEIKAPIAGRIASVSVVPGQSVTSGMAVATIDIAEKGYICEITVSSEEARKIQIGAPCTVVNSWWYSDVKGQVSRIRADASSQGKNKIITIDVTGEVYEGMSVTFSVGDKSQSYSSVLPNSAIREDNDGKFVLVVESKKTPLGMRYTAKRRTITVLASDDTKSAVEGVQGGEFVITSSIQPISDKQKVRLADNS